MDFEGLLNAQQKLLEYIPHGHTITDQATPSVIAGYGIIEETLEYLNSIGFKSWRPIPQPREEQLEELTDILFFYLELVLFSGFTTDEIEKEYKRKWIINVARWQAAKEGDYSWDDRSKEGL